ncbi:hypothetical protein MBM_05406 [Drepanopeziza brunnea f. sp. 'multigermtubi' MB_m1]|uniref:Uncharacterized protein n=1 Tax=Marssonina brunnea f. sp. multigermtubi (strain MB_m1) TaxID=1072389 RepID=K1WUK4_MARBU|nr:uncharacterized protein MBM_05406 [Drepanopeziza brunnea f. sp. 'multigermtubi' MB_m1]EKD16112.1 hypothetical protein MBM_05406 [Drepanopeziza brunnea f. sp. 'multigermtubi' MB_m1]
MDASYKPISGSQSYGRKLWDYARDMRICEEKKAECTVPAPETGTSAVFKVVGEMLLPTSGNSASTDIRPENTSSRHQQLTIVGLSLGIYGSFAQARKETEIENVDALLGMVDLSRDVRVAHGGVSWMYRVHGQVL